MSNNGAVSRESILVAGRVPKIEPCEAFGGCYVREMSGELIAGYQRWLTENEGATGADNVVALLLRTLCDADGNLQFNPQSEDDVEALRGCATSQLREAEAVAARINGVTEDDVETAEGNSDATHS